MSVTNEINRTDTAKATHNLLRDAVERSVAFVEMVYKGSENVLCEELR